MMIRLAKIPLIATIALSILFSGCATKERIVIQKCDAEIPLRPLRADYKNEFDYLKAIFEYTYKLESLTELCY